jgi:hypothetical protein
VQINALSHVHMWTSSSCVLPILLIQTLPLLYHSLIHLMSLAVKISPLAQGAVTFSFLNFMQSITVDHKIECITHLINNT